MFVLKQFLIMIINLFLPSEEVIRKDYVLKCGSLLTKV